MISLPLILGNDYSNLILLSGCFAVGFGISALGRWQRFRNHPQSKIRGAAMGLVSVSGHTKARMLQTSPVTGQPCAWWRLQLFCHTGNDSSIQVASFASPGFLYLEDETGSVLFDPEGASLPFYFHADLQGPTRIFDILTAVAYVPWRLDLSYWLQEDFLPEGVPLYVFGELRPYSEETALRKRRFQTYLKRMKQYPDFFPKPDGTGDARITIEEWDAFVAREEEKFHQETSQPVDKNVAVLGAPDRERFIVKFGEKRDETQSRLFRYFILSLPLGAVAIAYGVLHHVQQAYSWVLADVLLVVMGVGLFLAGFLILWVRQDIVRKIRSIRFLERFGY